jgi:hypothetical protein
MNLSFVFFKYRIVKVEVWLQQSLNVLSVVLDKSCKEIFVEVNLAISELL